ncbi:MAG TPA: RNA polymerase factor sigma-54 [Candidatus Cloacimonadota bacterium]|nr:RNA polymerase factor sigma-54 [Candidatus Cloacimonadota bacterium]
MADYHSLNLYQGLKMKQELKPKMLQSLQMLAMPIMELEQHLKQELITNPLLEMREDRDSEDDVSEVEPDTNKENDNDIEDNVEEELSKNVEEVKELSEILDNWNEYHHEITAKGYEGEETGPEMYVPYVVDGKVTFLQQLYVLQFKDNELDFATDLLDSVNQYGFLPNDYHLEENAAEYGISPERAMEIHQTLLHLDPPGITARSIQECLLAQLSEDQLKNDKLVNIIKYEFENLIHRRYQKIASNQGISEDQVLHCRNQIAKLDPKPGLRISNAPDNFIIPDVIIKEVDGEFEVIVNDALTPNIILNPRYKKMINRKQYDRETIQFVREKINSAKFLIKSMYMRMRTLERVTQSIIKHQHDFFYRSSGVLVPLTYSFIAQDLDVSESTISRVVRHKYADTPFGVIPLKNFFSSTAGRDDNYESVSRQRVKTLIQKYIDVEDKANPISDKELVDMLKNEGLNISWRIVAKYRDEMGVLNSRLRRV